MNTLSSLVQALRPWGQICRRVQLMPSDSAPPPTGTGPRAQALGLPYAEAGQAWPMCPACGQPMTFWAQWATWGQFWTLYGCRHELQSDPAPLHWLVRSFDQPHNDRAVVIQPPDRTPPVACHWTEIEGSCFPAPYEPVIAEHPAIEEWKALETPEERQSAWQSALDALGIPHRPLHTRVGGWPVWQGLPEWGVCVACKQPRALLLQLDDEPEAHGVWGPHSLYLIGCPDHPETLELRQQQLRELATWPLPMDPVLSTVRVIETPIS